MYTLNTILSIFLLSYQTCYQINRYESLQNKTCIYLFIDKIGTATTLLILQIFLSARHGSKCFNAKTLVVSVLALDCLYEKIKSFPQFILFDVIFEGLKIRNVF